MPKAPPDPQQPARDQVLRSWIALERFETQTPQRPDGRTILDLEPGSPLPWELGHPVQRQPVKDDRVEWRHALHIGLFDVARAYARVEAAFPDPEEDRNQRRARGGLAPLVSVALTSTGHPIIESIQVSSAAWSIAQTLRVGTEDRSWLQGFEGCADDVRIAFASIVTSEIVTPVAVTTNEADPSPQSPPVYTDIGTIDEDGVGPVPLDWSHVMRLLGATRGILEIDDELGVRPIARSTSWRISKRAPFSTTETLLNSFAVGDLERVARRLQEYPPGAALGRYLDAAVLATSEASDRIDLDADLAAVRAIAAPDRIPAGRWPSNPAQDLALGQQLAVNLATDPSDAPTILAVNGPPGTGKTTMLRELVAAAVTRRADAIAAFAKPSEIFKGQAMTTSGERPVKVDLLHPSLTGHELLLACATNAAAQNVSVELPAAGAIDAEWADEATYLPGLATAALQSGAHADDAPWEHLQAWGLISARLGKRRNCKAFDGAVWWGNPPGERGRAQAARGQDALELETEPTEALGLDAWLRSTEPAAAWKVWSAARAAFLAARQVVEAIRDERSTQQGLAVPLERLQEELEAAEDRATLAASALAAADTERESATAQATTAVTAYDAAKAVRRPLGPVPQLAPPKPLAPAAQERQDARRAAQDALEIAKAAAKEALERLRIADEAQAAAVAEHDLATSRLEHAADRVQAKAAGRDNTGAAGASTAEASESPAAGGGEFTIPGEAWEDDRAARDLRAPWSDERWNRARTELFLAGLRLHEATLQACHREVRRNLKVAMDLLSGRQAGLPRDVTRAAWQTLFLAVPVVSTTFASLPTMLAGLGEADLGTLLIDEAGQATPQQAVGGLWRCKRAVIVGDPLQLEPVSTLPRSLAEAIRKRFEVDPLYISAETSVQRLADAVTHFGGVRGSDRDELWVGVPLNVHRRCEGPIFAIVNRIAYRGRMVNATHETPAHPALRVESCWLDVPGGAAGDGHWIPAEGDRLDALLGHLSAERYDFRELFAISPFQDVARQLRRRAEHRALRGMTAGTVHTIQGREADTVVLVLGGDPARPGARAWAAHRPNLLNVAVSRARQRLYVIGDYAAWTDLPHFAELRTLRRVGPRPR